MCVRRGMLPSETKRFVTPKQDAASFPKRKDSVSVPGQTLCLCRIMSFPKNGSLGANEGKMFMGRN